MKAMDVAKYFLHKANIGGDLITNLRLQKLLYYAQAWYLVNFDRPLFSDEIKAWRFGPVIESVYHKFKKFRHTAIIYKSNGEIEKIFSTTDLDFLNEFYNIYIDYSANALLQMSHNEAPWKEAYESPSQIITIARMKEFYTQKYEELIGEKA